MITILIDGQSGAGKTTLANQLAAHTGFQLVHLDDFYPGWTGLAAASTIVARDILSPKNPGYFKWDWERDCQGQWVPVQPARSIIIEGTGAITADTCKRALALGELKTIRLTGPEQLRKQRALKRDPGYAPFWEIWAEQEEQHLANPIDVDYEIVLGSIDASGRPEDFFDSLGTAQSS